MELDKFVINNLDDALKNLQSWIRINSVDDSQHQSINRPFGDGVYYALQFIKDLALQEGFEVDECDGYCTEIKLGNGPKLISIYAHADVVPVSGEWKFEPFSGAIDQEKMYGRGTSDDKGPALAAFYALKYIKKNVSLNNYQIRLIIGGNEEKGGLCLKHYFEDMHKPYPDYGFTPDGEFPLIYGEKGIANYQSTINLKIPELISFHSGVVINSVPDYAVAELIVDYTFEDYLKQMGVNYQISYKEKTMRIEVKGKAAHGSLPDHGINAGLLLLTAIAKHYQNDFLKYITKCYENPFGKNLNLYTAGKFLNETTFNVGLWSYENDTFSMSVNFRYPENVDIDKVILTLNKNLPMKTVLLNNSSPLLFEPNSPLVKTLLKAYQDVTNDYQTPIMTIGGGTYAKECRNTIAFGSAFPGREDHIHDANEKIHIVDFEKSISIYATAIMYLMKL